MSTEYEVAPDLYLLERSSECTLYTGSSMVADRLTPQELVRIGLEFIKVASYLYPDMDALLKVQGPEQEWAIAELKRAL